MSFELFQQPIPVHPHPPYSFTYPTYSPDRTLDKHLHALWHTHNPTSALYAYVMELYRHHTKHFSSHVYYEQIHALHTICDRLSSCISNEICYGEELESLYTALGVVIKDMVYYPPRYKNEYEINRDSNRVLIAHISHIIKIHTMLCMKILHVDQSPNGMETKRLRNLILKMKYYLEHKRIQIGNSSELR
ncbi:MAG: hypothetical protein QG589_531 [Patescibacteria group bacterium]|nr:hypothetical protein [Patescibacteria group bacterium]